MDEMYTYTVVASDIDGDTLSYSLEEEPTGMLISSNLITWTPAEGTTTSGEVTLTVSDGELNVTETFTITVKASSSIENAETEHITLYPNPTHGNFHIQFSETYDDIGLSISDLTGKIITTQRFYNTDRIESRIVGQKGVYIANIELGAETVRFKLLKK
jgi:hypothetical protein